MNDYQRRIKENERDILQTKLDGYKDMLAAMYSDKQLWDPGLYAREHTRVNEIIEGTQKGIAEISSQLEK